MGVTSDTDFGSEALFSWPVPRSGFEFRRLIAAELVFDGLDDEELAQQPLARRDRSNKQVLRFRPEPKPCDALVLCEPGDDYGRLYDPLRIPDLFLEFSRCAPEPGHVLNFANKYGWLGTQTRFIRSSVGTKGQRILYGDKLDLWETEIAHMQDAVALWRSLVSSDIAELTARITWGPSAMIYKPSGWTIGLRHFPSISKGNILAAARVFLATAINEGTARHGVTPWLTIDGAGNIRRTMRPANLIAALWFQFHLTITGDNKLSRCSECGELMTYSRASKRMHPACANRKRQQQFKERHRAKKTRSR